MGKDKQLIINDLWLSAFIVTKTGYQPTLTFKNGVVVFIFDTSNEVVNAITSYQKDDPIPIYSFVRTYKSLKANMLNLKILQEQEGKDGKEEPEGAFFKR